MEIKIIAPKAGEPIRLGNDIIELEDHSSSVFSTVDLKSFVDYVGLFTPDELNDFGIFCSTSKTILKHLIPNRYSTAAAMCEHNKTNALRTIECDTNRSLTLGETERFLRVMRRYHTTSSRQLYDYVRNFEQSKITSVKRLKDDRGNFQFEVKRENAAGVDPTASWGKEISFSVPLLDKTCIEKEFVFDVVFTWKETDNGLELKYSFENPELKDEIDNLIREVVEFHLQGTPVKQFWGLVSVLEKTDDWKYKTNGLRV